MATPDGVVSESRSKVEESLLNNGQPLTLGYKPSMLQGLYLQPDHLPYYRVLWDVQSMLAHPVVSLALSHYDGAIGNAEFLVKASSQQVADFALEQIEHFWSKSLGQTQLGYRYGWLGAEPIYKTERHKLIFDGLIAFDARDAAPLTRKNRYVGIRVKNIETTVDMPGNQSIRKLWGPRKTVAADDEPDIPAKAFWYAHNPQYHRWYGRTQLYGAWRPWRRLSGMDGAENVTDAGVYRFAYMGPTVRYPVDDSRRMTGDNTFESSRDRAREFAENAKAGVSVALPSTYYENGQPKWSVDWPDHTINVDSLVGYCEHLEKKISAGIGVPPELMEAADVGSGYSGRAIPMEAFLMNQQRIADAILSAFVQQILDPLIRWNFGKNAWIKPKVKSLLKTKSQQAQGQEAGGQAPPQAAPQPAAPAGAPAGQGGGNDPLAALLGSGNMSTLRRRPALAESGKSNPRLPRRRTPGGKKVQLLAREVRLVRANPKRLSQERLELIAENIASLTQRQHEALRKILGIEATSAVSAEGMRVDRELKMVS